MSNGEFSLYILRCADNSLYTGIAIDVERRFADSVRSRNLKPLEEKLVYGPGKFQYHDNLTYGGKTALHALRRTGYTGGQWGLNLPPRTSGEVVWRFANPDLSEASERTVIWRMIRFPRAELTFLDSR